MNKDSIIDLLGFLIVKALSVVSWCIPLRMALWIGRRAGDLARITNSRRRTIAYTNLKAAFPEKKTGEIKKILKSHYQNLGMSVVELLKLPVMGKKYLHEHLKIENFSSIERSLAKGKGIILLSAHFGNWEIASLAASSRGHSFTVFAREQKHSRLNDLLNGYREMTGCKVITKGYAVRGIIKTLYDNGIVAMVSDQDAGSNGVFVNFMHRPASTAQGPISFALKTGAQLIPCFVWRSGFKDHIIEIGESLELVNTGEKEKDIRKNLDRITDILETRIRKHPDQWLWSHKRWKSSPHRTVLVLSDGKAGHLNQAVAVAEMVEQALGSRLEARGIVEKPIVKIKVVEVKFKNRVARIALDINSIFSGRYCQGCLKCLKFCLKKETFNELKNQYADVVISCGSSTVAANIFLKNENSAKGIVIMKPGLGRAGKSDLIILPGHDEPYRLRRNMLVTDAAPNRIITAVKGEGLGVKGLGLLIGGDAKNFKLEKQDVEKVIDGVLKIAEDMDRDIFISTSRRTSSEIDSLLKERLKGNKRCRLLVIANDKNIKGAVQKILDSSELVVVSPESISMISEAVSAKRRVVVFGVKGEASNHSLRSGTGHGLRVKGKYGRNVTNLEKQGYVKTAPAEEIYDVIKQVLRQRPALKELGDRKRIIERLQGIV